MSSLRRALMAMGFAVVVILVGTAGSAFAGQTLQECIDQAENHGGEPPTCTEVNGSWVASWDDGFPGGGGSGAGAIVLLFVIVGLAGVALLVWKISTARRLATESGMDPGLATQMTLLTDNGLETTYLAASLRQPTAASSPSPVEQETTAKRLGELKQLLDQGLITQVEHDEQRRTIINAV